MATVRIGSSKRLLDIWNLIAVLTLANSVPLAFSLRIDKSVTLGKVTNTNPQSFKPGIERDTTTELGFKVDLERLHHSKTPNLSTEDRAIFAVKSSQARAEYFHSRIHKNSKRFSGKAAFNSPLVSNQGGYVMQIKLGTPARTFKAIADTGSDVTWVQCNPCTTCFSQPDPVFNPSQSSSYRAISCTNPACDTVVDVTGCGTGNVCEYRVTYGGSATQGVLSFDTVGLSNGGRTQSFPNFKFGCGNINQGLFFGVDGLVGLGNGPVSLVGQLGGQFGNVFSYCLAGYYSTKVSTINFGSTGGRVSYTPLLRNPVRPSFYYVNLLTILVNGKPLNIPPGTFAIDSSGGGGILVDSGTTLSMLPSAGYRPLLDALENLIDYPRVDGSSIGLDLCYDLSKVPKPAVPEVTFRFQNVDVGLPFDNLFLQVDDAGDYCLAIVETNLDLGIYGNIQQANFNIAFNRASGQLGFAPKEC